MADLEIAKMLTMSTAHLREVTCNVWLGSADRTVVAYRKGEYGWFVHANHAQDDMPNELQLCVQFAREQGCAWVVFDCDAEQVDGLVTYDW